MGEQGGCGGSADLEDLGFVEWVKGFEDLENGEDDVLEFLGVAVQTVIYLKRVKLYE